MCEKKIMVVLNSESSGNFQNVGKFDYYDLYSQ